MVIITQEKVVIEKIFKKIRMMKMKKFKKKIKISIIRFLKILSIRMKLTIHI